MGFRALTPVTYIWSYTPGHSNPNSNCNLNPYHNPNANPYFKPNPIDRGKCPGGNCPVTIGYMTWGKCPRGIFCLLGKCPGVYDRGYVTRGKCPRGNWPVSVYVFERHWPTQ